MTTYPPTYQAVQPTFVGSAQAGGYPSTYPPPNNGGGYATPQPAYGAPVMGYPTQPQPPMYPPPHLVNGYPTPTCRFTRPVLERAMADSGYGQNQDIFRCHFVASSVPPRCCACGRLIAEHDNGYAAAGFSPMPMSTGAPQQPMSGTTAVVVSHMLSWESSSPQEDVYVNDTYLPLGVAGIIGMIISIIIFVIVFVSIVITKNTAPGVIAVPIVLILLSLFMISAPHRIRMHVKKNDKIIACTDRRFLFSCCTSSIPTVVPFQRLIGIRTTNSFMRINRVPYVWVLLEYAACLPAGVPGVDPTGAGLHLGNPTGPGGAVHLMLISVHDVDHVTAAWQQYFQSLGVPLRVVIEWVMHSHHGMLYP